VLVIGFIGWTTFARVVRAETLSVRNREFVEAARALGQHTPIILLRHVLPAIMAPIIVVATLNVATVIILEASLSFLGFGVQPPTVTWGRMLADGRNYVATAWWLATFPGVFITCCACRSSSSATGCATCSTRACAAAEPSLGRAERTAGQAWGAAKFAAPHARHRPNAGDRGRRFSSRASRRTSTGTRRTRRPLDVVR
jgi:hypothetical protein